MNSKTLRSAHSLIESFYHLLISFLLLGYVHLTTANNARGKVNLENSLDPPGIDYFVLRLHEASTLVRMRSVNLMLTPFRPLQSAPQPHVPEASDV